MPRSLLLSAIVFMGALLACPDKVACATFQDALGREVSLAKAPARIVALAPNLVEILYFLGLGECLVGVTDHSTYPPAARGKPSVGS